MSAAHELASRCAVLLIEDQALVRDLAAQTLRMRLGCTVEAAGTLAEAKKLIEARGTDSPYFVAVADLHLPDADAGKILSTLTAADIPAIGVTASFDKDLRESMLLRGAVDYVIKDNTQVFRYVADQIRRLWCNRGQAALVVDDSAAARQLVKNWLGRQQLTVYLAADGQEALEVFKEHPDICLVVTDCHMPRMDGFGLVGQLRRKHDREHLAIVGVSSSDDNSLSARFLKLGANDYLGKPFTYEELCARVNQNIAMLDSVATLREQATRDALTGLFNRRHFYDQAPLHARSAAVNGQVHATLMLDIDFFKKVNDTYGHPAGDAVIRHMAQLLARHFNDGLVARLGGEEFSVMLTTTPAEAKARAEAFRQALEESPTAHDGRVLSCTCSVGLCLTPGLPAHELLQRADLLLYEAKSSGRNRVCASDAP